MTDKAFFDLDAAIAALEHDERAARPTVSAGLQARVLTAAAEIAAQRNTEAVQASRHSPRHQPKREGLLWFGLFDAWSGGAIAAVMLCMIAGLGVGYEAGAEVMAQAGLSDTELAFVADDDSEFILFGDIL